MKRLLEPGAIGAGADDPRLMSRTLGVLMCCGGLAVILGTALVAPAGEDDLGLLTIGLVGLGAGAVALVWARSARAWTAHALFAVGTALICLASYFANGATGLYAVLLVWMAIVAATFFSARAIVAHIAWIMICSGLMLALVEDPPGPSPLARWAFGGVLMAIAATVMSRIAAGRRATEERLRAEIAERERLQRKLEHLADHDPLTGVANRRRLDQELGRALARARRQGTPLCVASLDLDGLKAHNDAHGHASGDRLLKGVASTWAAGLGEADLIARTGGDEFVLVLPDRPPEAARRLLERLRDDVAAACSCSAGVACWDGRESREELQVRADLAMYEAKARSRPGSAEDEAYSAATRVCQTGSSGRS